MLLQRFAAVLIHNFYILVSERVYLSYLSFNYVSALNTVNTAFRKFLSPGV